MPPLQFSNGVLVDNDGIPIASRDALDNLDESEPDLRGARVADWPQSVFSTDDVNCPATTLTFEHGQFVARGSGGTGSRSNRRSVFLVPNSPGGYSRIRSRISGRTQLGSLVPQWGHMHGLGVQADGRLRGAIVWTDIVANNVAALNVGMWEAGPFNAVQATNADAATVTDGSRTTNVVTLTVNTGHGFVVGDQVEVDVADATYDGKFELSAVAATTLTYAQDAANDASCGAGTVRLSTREPFAARVNREVAATDAARATNIVTAQLGNDSHPLMVGDVVNVDFADNTYDGDFTIRTALLGTVTWRQAAADDPAAGAGTIRKRLPYWLETEWRPGYIRLRAWPDTGFGSSAFQTPPPAGPQWCGVPPWESAASYTATTSALNMPDPSRGLGCALVVAHPTGGSSPTDCRYDSVKCTPLPT